MTAEPAAAAAAEAIAVAKTEGLVADWEKLADVVEAGVREAVVGREEPPAMVARPVAREAGMAGMGARVVTQAV